MFPNNLDSRVKLQSLGIQSDIHIFLKKETEIQERKKISKQEACIFTKAQSKAWLCGQQLETPKASPVIDNFQPVKVQQLK